jgi:hypothetical protein
MQLRASSVAKQTLLLSQAVSIFRSLSMQKLLKQYTEISEREAIAQTQQMGFSRLRLLPKATGVRPIATLCKRSSFPAKTERKVTRWLQSRN